LKKRELADGETQGPGKKAKKGAKDTSYISPIRYRLPSPKPTDFDPPKAPLLTPITEKAGKQLYETTEHVYNRKGFRYTNAIVDPRFPSSRYHRASEVEPFESRIDFKDAGSHMIFDDRMLASSTEKGFRLARANVGAREGRFYWECKILSGVKQDPMDGVGQEGGGHIRVGWARREASLEGPVGFDAYSYGLRDVQGQKVHMSRPKDFANSDFCEGDVIGLEITLPSLSLHRKVVDGVYNKAVDVSDDLDPASSGEFPDIIRDRVPIRYKTQLYFEQFEYSPVKALEELANPNPAVATANTPATNDPPNPNHPEASLRTLPFSNIKIYKNGEVLGTPFTDLLSFLPPASKPLPQAGARDGLDDGTLGYYPAISTFRGGAVEANLGPNFQYPPPDLTTSHNATMPSTSSPLPQNPTTKKPITGTHSRLRPMSSRFNEQIAEDITIDIIDEVDFWAQDGEEGEGAGNEQAPPSILGPVDPKALDVVAAAEEVGDVLGVGTGIREIVQEEE